MSKISTKERYQASTSSVQDFHVKLLVTLERDWDLMTQEEHSFLKSIGLSKRSDLKNYSLKMLMYYLAMPEEEHLQPSSPYYMNWGTTLNGKLLMANISFHRTARESSLSDIIENSPSKGYFLSEKAQKIVILRAKNRLKQQNRLVRLK